MKFVLPLDQMTREEKLEALELLWADLSAEAGEQDAPSWHGQILAKRRASLDAGQMELLDWDAAKQDLISPVNEACHLR